MCKSRRVPAWIRNMKPGWLRSYLIRVALPKKPKLEDSAW